MIHFGQGHDRKYGEKTIQQIPENRIGIMERGLASIERINRLPQSNNHYLVMRIKNNLKLKMLESGECLIGSEQHQVKARIINFCNLESKSEYCLVTN